MIHTSIIWIREIILLAVGMRGIFIDVSRVIGLKKKRKKKDSTEKEKKKCNRARAERGLVPTLGDPLPAASPPEPAWAAPFPVFRSGSPLEWQAFPHTPGDGFLKMAHYLSFK